MRRIFGYKDKLFFARAFNGGFVQNINIINRTAKQYDRALSALHYIGSTKKEAKKAAKLGK